MGTNIRSGEEVIDSFNPMSVHSLRIHGINFTPGRKTVQSFVLSRHGGKVLPKAVQSFVQYSVGLPAQISSGMRLTPRRRAGPCHRCSSTLKNGRNSSRLRNFLFFASSCGQCSSDIETLSRCASSSRPRVEQCHSNNSWRHQRSHRHRRASMLPTHVLLLRGAGEVRSITKV